MTVVEVMSKDQAQKRNEKELLQATMMKTRTVKMLQRRVKKAKQHLQKVVEKARVLLPCFQTLPTTKEWLIAVQELLALVNLFLILSS